jgi:serine/threonine protein kinase
MKLRHENILPLIGINDTLYGDRTALISPLQPNGNLTDYIVSHPDFDLQQGVLDIANGLHFLHSHEMRIVHGDLKGVRTQLSLNHSDVLTTNLL